MNTSEEGLKKEDILRTAEMLLECLNIGMIFSINLTKKSFNAIIKDVNERRMWAFLPNIFGTQLFINCETNWLLEAYKRCKNKIPKEMLWNILMDVYIFNSFDFPMELIFEALPYRPTNYLSMLPSRYNEDEYITVYRATNKNLMLNNPRYGLAWTINPHVAKEYYKWRLSEDNSLANICYCYKAQLKKSDILMCVDTRNGNDKVLQFGSVTDVTQLSDFALEKRILMILCKLKFWFT